eukprot:COSAG06_NODE_3952_length_4727_cov_2.586646_7_plen_176_part_00
MRRTVVVVLCDPQKHLLQRRHRNAIALDRQLPERRIKVRKEVRKRRLVPKRQLHMHVAAATALGRFDAGARDVALDKGQHRVVIAAAGDIVVACQRLRKRHSFVEFSLCFSRACLGKMMHFIQNGAKVAFLYQVVAGAVAVLQEERAAYALQLACRNRPFLLNFSYVCPEPVLVN